MTLSGLDRWIEGEPPDPGTADGRTTPAQSLARAQRKQDEARAWVAMTAAERDEWHRAHTEALRALLAAGEEDFTPCPECGADVKNDGHQPRCSAYDTSECGPSYEAQDEPEAL